MAKIEVKTVKLGEIKLNPDNPRTISKKDMDLLIKSLKDFPDMLSIREIVVDETMTVLGGNMRLLALKKSGVKECTAKIVSGLSPAQKREFIIKDNSAFGEWDMDLLSSSWGDLPLVEWGVDLPEDWLSSQATGEPADAEPQIDKASELNKVWKVKSGDLWQIGDHRLLCGDSTKKEDVERLMGGEKALLMVTDPPYGVNYDASWRVDAGVAPRSVNCGKVQNDDVSDWFPAFDLFTGDIVYVWHAGVFASTVQGSIERCGFVIRAQIVWNKDLAVFGRGDYHWKHEPCWYAVRKGAKGNRTDDHKQSTVWDIPTIHSFANGKNAEEWKLTGHGTQKPLECMARPIRNHESEFVYDPFLGSGTTLIACENLKRRCFGIEISPDYVAVCLQRFEDAFGIKGVRVD